MLFIGGVFDGQRRAIPQQQQSYIHAYSYNSSNHAAGQFPTDPSDSTGITTHSFRIERLHDGRGNYYEVAVDPKITNIIEALIKGYHYHRRDKGLRGCRPVRY